MIGMSSTLAPNFSVACGRPGVAISGGAADVLGVAATCAARTSCARAVKTLVAAAAIPKNVRRVLSS
jgi:hypothetical protein